MPRAAHGKYAREVMRRKLPEYLGVPGSDPSRRPIKCPYRPGMERYLQSQTHRSLINGALPQLLSVYRVERGRLGKVVSLVGDCRPPPPGSPHRPTTSLDVVDWIEKRQKKVENLLPGDIYFATKRQIIGGLTYSVWMHCTFNICKITRNLKILNSAEYFKENRSYFYCTGKKPVLEFGSFHSHLCGLDEVKLPSIAITNVLKKRV